MPSSGNVATLSVSLKARTEKFRRGLKQAETRAEAFSRKLRTLSVKAGALGAAIGAAAGIAGVGLLVKSQFKAIDAAGKLSDRIAIQTEKLMGLHHAANITGTSTESLDSSLLRMTRNIGDAIDGTGDAAEAFSKLGLDAQGLANMGADAAFKSIAGAISELPTQAEKADAAMRIFGRSGGDLLTLLDQGEAGIAGLQEEAERLGITVGRDAAAKIEAANDAFTRMKAVIVGAAQSIAVQLAPFVIELGDRLTNSGNIGQKVSNMIVEGFRFIALGVAKASGVVDLFLAGWKLLQVGIGHGVVFIADGIEMLITSMANLADAVGLDGVAGSLREFELAANAMRTGARAQLSVAERELHEFLVAESMEEKVNKFFDGVRARADAIGDAAKAANDEAVKLKMTLDESEVKTEEIASGTDSIRDDRGSEPRGLTGSIQSAIGAFTVSQNPVVNEIKEQTRVLKQAIERTGGGLVVV